MRSESPKSRGPKTKGYTSIAALKLSYAVDFLRDPGASAADAADRAASSHPMKTGTEAPSRKSPTLVNVGRRKVVSFARRLTPALGARQSV
jgi:hypothetical protein